MATSCDNEKNEKSTKLTMGEGIPTSYCNTFISGAHFDVKPSDR